MLPSKLWVAKGTKCLWALVSGQWSQSCRRWGLQGTLGPDQGSLWDSLSLNWIGLLTGASFAGCGGRMAQSSPRHSSGSWQSTHWHGSSATTLASPTCPGMPFKLCGSPRTSCPVSMSPAWTWKHGGRPFCKVTLSQRVCTSPTSVFTPAPLTHHP